MALIYGSGFKPMKVEGVTEKKTAADVGLFTLIRVVTAVAFIALSFIPVAGEVAEAGLLAGEAALEAGLEAGLEVGAEAALETATEIGAESVLETGTALANTAKALRLGDTLKGSLGLGLAEAGVNEAIDRIEGTGSMFNSIINFGLAFTPVLGFAKGRRFAQIRFAKSIEKQIEYQEELLKIAKTLEQRSQIELRIRQLKNAKLIRTTKIYGAALDSATVSVANREAIKIIEEGSENAPIYAKSLMRDLRTKMAAQDIKLSKTEARLVVKSLSRKIPDISWGVSLHGIVESKTYNRVLETMRYLDPNLAARKFWTAAARKLSSNEALFRLETKSGTKEFGKWFKKVNLGYYKKFGKKLSAWWRKWGKKIYKHSRVRMIPVVSKWIEGYRLIPTGIPGEYIMIVIFKPSKSGRIPPPVTVNPVTLAFAMEFASGEGYGGSVGSFYINRIALSRNGSGPSISGSLASILGPLSLGLFRKALAGPAAFERIIRKVTKGDYFQTFSDNITETSNRLWTHKVGKVIAGRWGIATARGFQSQHKGHTQYFSNPFDTRHLIEEMGVVTLDKARAVQRKAGIQGRTTIIGARRTSSQWRRTVKLGTFGYMKYDGKKGFKKGKGIFNI